MIEILAKRMNREEHTNMMRKALLLDISDMKTRLWMILKSHPKTTFLTFQMKAMP
mgnify:CR=1 FL=1